jgi:sec-independent protein translocase protein TatA
MFGLGIQELVLILVIAMFFFGGKKLPEMAKGLGKGIREFKRASERGADDEDEHIESKGHEESKKKLESKS